MYTQLDDVKPALVMELMRFYDYLLSEGMVQEIDGLRFVMDYLSGEMIDTSREPSLYEQLSNHTMEISTLKEADLCGSSNMKERIFVTTIHQAKGLEFDNVIVFDAVDGQVLRSLVACQAQAVCLAMHHTPRLSECAARRTPHAFHEADSEVLQGRALCCRKEVSGV